MFKVNVVWLVFLQVRVKHFDYRDFSTAFYGLWIIPRTFSFIHIYIYVNPTTFIKSIVISGSTPSQI